MMLEVLHEINEMLLTAVAMARRKAEALGLAEMVLFLGFLSEIEFTSVIGSCHLNGYAGILQADAYPSWQLRASDAARVAYCSVLLPRGPSNVQPAAGFPCRQNAGLARLDRRQHRRGVFP
jgi:hypothetical protein